MCFKKMIWGPHSKDKKGRTIRIDDQSIALPIILSIYRRYFYCLGFSRMIFPSRALSPSLGRGHPLSLGLSERIRVY